MTFKLAAETEFKTPKAIVIVLMTLALSMSLLPSAIAEGAEQAQDEHGAHANDRQTKGMQMIGKLLAGTGAGGMPLPEKFRQYTVEHLFGEVWQGDDLSLQDRSFATCMVLIALNREAEMRLHFVGAKNVGIPREKLEAAITHVVHYAGWPVGMTAFKVLNEVWPVGEASIEE
jgi:alkylhydroperoxidase/carboxymuconolactone decarboxylase family protein YurZ